MSTVGDSNIIFLLLCDLHSSTPLTSLMALFSYSWKCLLSYITCVFTCHCVWLWCEHCAFEFKQYCISCHTFNLKEGMFISELYELVFHSGCPLKNNIITTFFVNESVMTVQKLYIYSVWVEESLTEPLYTYSSGSVWFFNFYEL